MTAESAPDSFSPLLGGPGQRGGAGLSVVVGKHEKEVSGSFASAFNSRFEELVSQVEVVNGKAL